VSAGAKRPEPVRDLDWDAKRARELGERALDIWAELLERLPELPVSRGKSQAEVAAAVSRPVPDDPMPLGDLVEHLRELVLEHSMYPGHPRFYAYITGAGTVPGAAADLLAAAVNQNLGGWRLSPGASELELHLTNWFARELGMPETGGGVFTSGGAMANFIALKVARDLKCGYDVKEHGVGAGPQLAIYASDEVHTVLYRAADLLGLGKSAIRVIPTDEEYRIRLDVLHEAIDLDTATGARPIAIVGSAGTVNTGAIDPLDALADLAEEHDLWFHVDGAYGAPAALAPDLRPKLAGMERADSIAFDPHKWLYVPHSAGAVLVRDLDLLSEAFSVHGSASYVYEDKDRTGTGPDLLDLSPQFSRGFQALKVWVSLLAHGLDAYRRRISHDAALARYLGERVKGAAEFELAAPVELSICCFRYVPPDLEGDEDDREAYLNALNERLMTDLQLGGEVFPSNAILGDRFVLRACIVNFRTEAEDLDALLESAAAAGARLDAEMRPSLLRG